MEFHVIESFLNRRDGLGPGVRTSMAQQISRRMGEKLGAREFGWPQTEHFLEAVYDQFRLTGRLRPSPLRSQFKKDHSES
jgi:hypothetical protein